MCASPTQKTTQPILDEKETDRFLEIYDYFDVREINKRADAIYKILTKGKTPCKEGESELFLVVGPAGAGKTTLTEQLLDQPIHKAHSVLIDPDMIRENIGMYKYNMEICRLAGLPLEQADAIGLKQWQPASRYIGRVLLNRAHADGYNIVCNNKAQAPVALEICTGAQKANMPVRTIVVHAPLDVAKKSIHKRVAAGGHPVNDAYLLSSYTGMYDALVPLLGSSESVTYYWRPNADRSPKMVAETTAEGDFHVYNEAGFAAMNKAIEIARPGMTLPELEAAFAALRSTKASHSRTGKARGAE